MLKRLGLSLVAVTLAAQAAMAQPTAVSIELQLLIDVSGSISATEYALQKTGYENVFNNTNASFWNDFAASNRTLAVQYAEWSSAGQQSAAGGANAWYLITNAASALTFANVINLFPRAFTSSSTAPGDAINYGINQLNTNSYNGLRRIIDISSDGCRNNGASTSLARDAAQAASITINAITIGAAAGDCGNLSLPDWYAANAVTTDGFLEAAAGFGDFNEAITRKIGREINVVPEPSTFAIMSAGLLGLAAVANRRRKQA